MKKRCILLFLLPVFVSAQNYSYLAGGRSAGLAHSSVAIADLWSTHHNQAGLAFLEKPAAGVSYENRFFLKDLSVANAAFAYPGDWGSIGASISHFGFELYHQSKCGLNYARAFGKYFSMGLQINYHDFYVAEGTANNGAVTFEAGLLARPTKKLNLGFHVFNPSRNYKNVETEERLPLIGRLGGRYAFSEAVALSAEIQKNQETEEEYRVGLEYGLLENLVFRTGAGLKPFRNSFGLGLNFQGFSADLSYEYARVLGNNANLSFQYGF